MRLVSLVKITIQAVFLLHCSQLVRLYINVVIFDFFLKVMVQLSLCQSHFRSHAQLQVLYSCVVGTARSTENHSSKCKS